MHKSILKAIALQKLPEKEYEDINSDEKVEVTNMEFVNKHRDFSKISEKDLDALFLKLRIRCPETWTSEFEIRAKELHHKFMAIKTGNSAIFIDPDREFVEAKNDKSDVQRLM